MEVAIEPIILPIRNLVRRVEGHSSRTDRRIHHRHWLDHARPVLVTGRWPAVVRPFHDDVELVVITRPVLGRQQTVAYRVEVKAERISQPVRPDRGLLALLPNKRIVIWTRSVSIHPNGLSG